MLSWRLEVAVQTPAHSALGDVLSYASAEAVAPGSLVRVPLGRREVLGVVSTFVPSDLIRPSVTVETVRA